MWEVYHEYRNPYDFYCITFEFKYFKNLTDAYKFIRLLHNDLKLGYSVEVTLRFIENKDN